MCLLDEEEAAVAGTMRASGDWVEVRDAQMFFLGRRDRLVKRHGKRLNLDGVQQVRRISKRLYWLLEWRSDCFCFFCRITTCF